MAISEGSSRGRSRSRGLTCAASVYAGTMEVARSAGFRTPVLDAFGANNSHLVGPKCERSTIKILSSWQKAEGALFVRANYLSTSVLLAGRTFRCNRVLVGVRNIAHC